jgi:hypothetical protein
MRLSLKKAAYVAVIGTASRKSGVRSPGFPVELVSVGEPDAAFLTESRTRSHGWSHAQEIRVGMTKFRAVTFVRSRQIGWIERNPTRFVT